MADAEKSSHSSQSTPLLSSKRKHVAFAFMCIAVFICCLETFIITTALPQITSKLEATDSDFAWVGSAYLLSYAAVIPIWARISEILGEKLVLLITSSIFLVGTVIGALSQDSAMLIAGRAVQGMGVGGLMVVINICVVLMYPPRERAFYFGIVGANVAISSAIGPFIGGALTEHLSWRYCFWIEIPFTTVSGMGIFAFYKSQGSRKPVFEGLKDIDWFGAIMISSGTVFTLAGLQFGVSHHGWSATRTITLLTLGPIILVAFAFVESKFPKFPLMPLRFFKTVPRVSILTGCFLQSLIMTATTYFIPVYFQVVLGASPLMSGVYFLPTTITLALLWASIGHLIKVTGEYVTSIRIGAAALLLGTGLLVDTKPYTSWPRIVTSQIIIAVGLGLTYQAPLIAFYEAIPREDASVGTSTFQFLKQFGQTISVVFGQVIIQGYSQPRLQVLVQPNTHSELLQHVSTGEIIPSILVAGPNSPEGDTMREIITNALRAMWIFYTGIAAIAFLASFGIPMHRLPSEAQGAPGGEENNSPAETKSLQNEKDA